MQHTHKTLISAGWEYDSLETYTRGDAVIERSSGGWECAGRAGTYADLADLVDAIQWEMSNPLSGNYGQTQQIFISLNFNALQQK